MRMITVAVAAGAVALPLTLGAAGIASADTYGQQDSVATPDGATSQSVHASAGDNGDATFHQYNLTAGPDGASCSDTTASTGTDNGHHTDNDEDGGLLGILGL